jgi:hypothetical protein
MWQITRERRKCNTEVDVRFTLRLREIAHFFSSPASFLSESAVDLPRRTEICKLRLPVDTTAIYGGRYGRDDTLSSVAGLDGCGTDRAWLCALPAGEHIRPVHASTHAHAAVCPLRREPGRWLESLPVRRAATTFSFYLAIPTLGAATIADLLGSLNQVTADDLARLLVGTLISFVVAWLSIGWLLRYVASYSFVAFGIYRSVSGALILGLLAAGWLA